MPTTPANIPAPAGPAGEPGRIKVLFFSRGRGRGHAMPDLAIAAEIPGLQGNIDLEFASYGTGAATFREAGWPVRDLGLPEANSYTHTFVLAHKLIERLQPDIVVSHEEFAALPAAHLADIPSVLLTDWYPAAGQAAAEAIAYANAIVFFGEAGVFPLPVPVQRAPVHVDPIIRRMTYRLADRGRARAELGLADRAFVAAVMPGAWATEERVPIAPLVLPAFRQLAVPEKNLLWLSKADQALLRSQTKDFPGLRAVTDCAHPEQIMVASDVIITKGNRGTILDAASLGVPSVSLSTGANHVDEILIPRIRSNTAFNAKAMTAANLCAFLEKVAAQRPSPPFDLPAQGAASAARALLAEINAVLSLFPPTTPEGA